MGAPESEKQYPPWARWRQRNEKDSTSAWLTVQQGGFTGELYFTLPGTAGPLPAGGWVPPLPTEGKMGACAVELGCRGGVGERGCILSRSLGTKVTNWPEGGANEAQGTLGKHAPRFLCLGSCFLALALGWGVI